jgi:methylenetetrahydrofolate reductase (NADPH)
VLWTGVSWFLFARLPLDGRSYCTYDPTVHIQDIFAAHATTFSFEFFPPKTPEASEQLFQTISHLEPLKPSFVDVTYGAGGGTRDLTNDLVLRIRRETKLETIPHLTCVCHTEPEIDQVLDQWRASGVSNILALSGDLPQGKKDWDRRDAFRYAADLVRHHKSSTGRAGTDRAASASASPASQAIRPRRPAGQG